MLQELAVYLAGADKEKMPKIDGVLRKVCKREGIDMEG